MVPKVSKKYFDQKGTFGHFHCFGGSAFYLYVNDPEMENLLPPKVNRLKVWVLVMTTKSLVKKLTCWCVSVSLMHHKFYIFTYICMVMDGDANATYNDSSSMVINHSKKQGY
jgi:hypothetical protein